MVCRAACVWRALEALDPGQRGRASLEAADLAQLAAQQGLSATCLPQCMAVLQCCVGPLIRQPRLGCAEVEGGLNCRSTPNSTVYESTATAHTFWSREGGRAVLPQRRISLILLSKQLTLMRYLGRDTSHVHGQCPVATPRPSPQPDTMRCDAMHCWSPILSSPLVPSPRPL